MCTAQISTEASSPDYPHIPCVTTTSGQPFLWMKKGVPPLLTTKKSHHPTVNGVDTFLRRNNHVEDEEMSLQSVRDVVLARPRVIHRSDVLQIFDHLQVEGMYAFVPACGLEDGVVGCCQHITDKYLLEVPYREYCTPSTQCGTMTTRNHKLQRALST